MLLLRIADWLKICIENTRFPITGDISGCELENVSFVVQYHLCSDFWVMQLMGAAVELKS